MTDPHVPTQSQHPQEPLQSFPAAQPVITPPSPPAPGKLAAWVAGHRKFLLAVLGGAATVVAVAWPANPPWWAAAIILAATAAGVHGVPNRQK